MRLTSVHAVHHMIALVRAARAAVMEGRYAAFRAAFLERYHSGETLTPSSGGTSAAQPRP
jgi:queuine/archaeosine tRNA-ribosyltransferase